MSNGKIFNHELLHVIHILTEESTQRKIQKRIAEAQNEPHCSEKMLIKKKFEMKGKNRDELNKLSQHINMHTILDMIHLLLLLYKLNDIFLKQDFLGTWRVSF